MKQFIKKNKNDRLHKSTSFSGSEACPCIDSRSILLSKANCKTSDNGSPGVKSTDGTSTCYPIDFGSSVCAQHDSLLDPRCSMAASMSAPLPHYCFESWCYVDYDKCMLSDELFFRTKRFPGVIEPNLFYSFSTCNSTYRTETETTEYLQQLPNLKVTIPTILYPYHYKLTQNGTVADINGPEYYNRSIPFQGVLVDYIQSIASYSRDINQVDIEFRSKGSDLKYPQSKFSASVRDVQVGLSDMALGPFWVTAERLRMVSHTTPIAMDKTYLVIKRPEVNNSIAFQFKKLTLPFEPSLWFLLISTMLFVGLLAIWFSSPNATNKRPWLAFRNDEWRESSFIRRFFIFYRYWLESVLEKGMEFFGGAVDQDFRSSLPHKLLMFGFSFLTFITASAYIANLAAYLTLKEVSDHIDSMEKAIIMNARICAHPILQDTISVVWPNADFYYSTKATEYRGILEDWDEGMCDILAIGWIDTQFDSDLMNMLCNRNLVFTKALVAEMPIAFPVRDNLAAGISHWIMDAEKNGAVSFEKLLQHYIPKFRNCLKIEYSANNHESGISLTMRDLTFPFCILAIFAGMAIGTKMCVRRRTLQAVRYIAQKANLDEASAQMMVDMVNFAHLEIDDIEKHDIEDISKMIVADDSEDELSTEEDSVRQRRKSTSDNEPPTNTQSSQANGLGLSRRLISSIPPDISQNHHGTVESNLEEAERFRKSLSVALQKSFSAKNVNRLTELDATLSTDETMLFHHSLQRTQESFRIGGNQQCRKSSRRRSSNTSTSRPDSLALNSEELTGLIQNVVERSVENAIETTVGNVVERSIKDAIGKL